MSGTFGYELDPRKLSEGERSQMRAQIDEFKRFYHLLQDGDYARLTNPFRDQEFTAWQHTAPDRSEALVSVVAGMAAPMLLSAPFIPAVWTPIWFIRWMDGDVSGETP